VKWILCVVALCGIGATGASDIIPRGITSEKDIEKYKRSCREYEPRNSYDTTSLVEKFKKHVHGDPKAEEGMKLFIDCRYLLLVDHCEDYLPSMGSDNAQLFREAIVLLAPWLDKWNYKQRGINIIGDPLSVTSDYFQHRTLLYEMFFYGEVKCGKRGYTWIMIETCINACTELDSLAENFGWPEEKLFAKMDPHNAAYDGACTEDTLRPRFTYIWPNLPDTF
jgi:hypothetical protein